jgi:hypothetical protein
MSWTGANFEFDLHANQVSPAKLPRRNSFFHPAPLVNGGTSSLTAFHGYFNLATVIIPLTLAALSIVAVSADPFSDWTEFPIENNAYLMHRTKNGPISYAVWQNKSGIGGQITRSTNGRVWQIAKDTPLGLNGIAFGNGIGVAAGIGGSIYLNSGQDENWRSVDSGSTNTLREVAYGKTLFGPSLFVVVGEQGALLYSTNGERWSRPTAAGTNNFVHVVYGNGAFVALAPFRDGNRVGSRLFSTLNGESWSFKESPNQFYAMAYGNGLFEVVGKLGQVFWSDNGGDWYDTELGKLGNGDIFDVAYGAGTFLALADVSVFAVSQDGKSWHYVSSPLPLPSFSHSPHLFFDSGKFVVYSLNRKNVYTAYENDSFQPRLAISVDATHKRTLRLHSESTLPATIGFSTDLSSWSEMAVLPNSFGDHDFPVAESDESHSFYRAHLNE